MSNWTPITEADLNAVKMAPLMAALRTAALAEGQTDPVEAIVATVVDRVRRKIAACATNRVDADGATVPRSLLSLACRMVVREAKDRLEMEMSETEREAWRVDERELNDIAACKLPVELPDEAVDAPVQVVQPGPSISGRRKQFSRGQQEGA
jgi:hypothetical protein